MAISLERPPTTDHDQDLRPPRRSLDRYQHHLWIGGLSLIVIAAFSAPMLLWPPAPEHAPAPDASAGQPINIAIPASEFNFSPTNIQAAPSTDWAGRDSSRALLESAPTTRRQVTMIDPQRD